MARRKGGRRIPERIKQQRDASLYLLKQEERIDLSPLYWWIIGMCMASMIWLIGIIIWKL